MWTLKFPSSLISNVKDMSVCMLHVNSCLIQTSKDFLGANDLIISVSDKIFQQI